MDQNEIPKNEFANLPDNFWKDWKNISQQIQGSCPPGNCKVYIDKDLFGLNCQNKKDVELSMIKNDILIENGFKNQNLDTAHYDCVLAGQKGILIPLGPREALIGPLKAYIGPLKDYNEPRKTYIGP